MATQKKTAPFPARRPAEKYRKWLLPAACALVALLIIGLSLFYILRFAEPEPEPPASSLIPENMLQVEDIYEGTRLIPKFDLPVCQYEREKFNDLGRFVRYEDGKALMGIDVSEFQGDIDWAQVKASEQVDFVIIRLGYRGMTQGLLVTDECFEKNYQGAVDAGLPVRCISSPKPLRKLRPRPRRTMPFLCWTARP